VILGYQVDKEGRLSALVLGTTHLGRLVHAGSVTPKMSEMELSELLQLLARNRAAEPIIMVESDRTFWVKPKFTCRVSYIQNKKGQLSDIEWVRMLGTIQVK
jgi:hypothetical protein